MSNAPFQIKQRVDGKYDLDVLAFDDGWFYQNLGVFDTVGLAWIGLNNYLKPEVIDITEELILEKLGIEL